MTQATEESAMGVANKLYRLYRNYTYRTNGRPEREVDVLLNRQTVHELMKDPEMLGTFIASQTGDHTFMGMNVIETYGIPEWDVRLVLRPNHPLLGTLPWKPPPT